MNSHTTMFLIACDLLRNGCVFFSVRYVLQLSSTSVPAEQHNLNMHVSSLSWNYDVFIHAFTRAEVVVLPYNYLIQVITLLRGVNILQPFLE